VPVASQRTKAGKKPARAAIRVSRADGGAARRFGVRELRLRVAELKALLADGMTDLEACDELGLDIQDYNALKREMYAQDKLELVGKSTEEVYADYVRNQTKCVRDLDDLADMLKKAGQPAAIVGAIKAKSDIFNRIIDTGQTFGIIEKVPERKQIIGGIAVGQLDNEELRKLIADQLAGLKQFVGRYGNVDLFGNPIEKDRKALPVQEAEIVVSPTDTPSKPKFSDSARPPMATGGARKAAGARATNTARRKRPATTAE
jgi:hypothetical protein